MAVSDSMSRKTTLVIGGANETATDRIAHGGRQLGGRASFVSKGFS
jgi:hypothetical protein